ncbi:MAG: hypothetical protein ING29_12715, partial [Azospirillum sp.]|nr:hypothetical protein [Azospirillum sp.]
MGYLAGIVGENHQDFPGCIHLITDLVRQLHPNRNRKLSNDSTKKFLGEKLMSRQTAFNIERANDLRYLFDEVRVFLSRLPVQRLEKPVNPHQDALVVWAGHLGNAENFAVSSESTALHKAPSQSRRAVLGSAGYARRIEVQQARQDHLGRSAAGGRRDRHRG